MNSKPRKTLHLVAGIYLFYLAYQLLTGIGNNGNPTVSIIGGIVFIVIGGYLILNFIRALKNGFEEQNLEEENINETEDVEEVKEEE